MTHRPHNYDPVNGPSLPPDAAPAFARQAERTPEWRPWLRLLETALRHADHDAWRGGDVRFAAARPAMAPLLEGARMLVDRQAAADLVADLFRAAAHPTEASADLDQAGVDRAGLDPLLILEAGLRQDRTILVRDGAPGDAEHALPGAIAHFAAMPLLLEAARRAVPAIPPAWSQGYCPVCAAWPTLVEMRGLERRRVLRCGRCATGWERDVLHCAFCGERDHRRQGSLVPDDEAELLRLEVCDACKGYVKVITTLRPKPPWLLALDDLRTLPLEWTALERGYRRPERPGWNLSARMGSHSDVAAGGGS